MNATISKLRFVLLAFAALTVVHCSKGGGGSSSGTTSTTCAANYLYTSGAGCLPTCGTNMVLYNNQCVSTTAVTTSGTTVSCNSGMLSYLGSCYTQCGTSAVMYNGTCTQITTSINTITGIGGVGSAALCTGSCGAGQVQTYQGCMPQYSCGACYGYNNGWCYIGVNAHQYYGY